MRYGGLQVVCPLLLLNEALLSLLYECVFGELFIRGLFPIHFTNILWLIFSTNQETRNTLNTWMNQEIKNGKHSLQSISVQWLWPVSFVCLSQWCLEEQCPLYTSEMLAKVQFSDVDFNNNVAVGVCQFFYCEDCGDFFFFFFCTVRNTIPRNVQLSNALYWTECCEIQVKFIFPVF